MTLPSRSCGRLAVFAAVAGLILTIACSNASTQSGATSTASNASASQSAAATPAQSPSGAAFCAKLQPLVRPLVKPTLTLFKASDPTTNELQAADAAYVECDFRQQDSQIDVSLHDDSDHRFDDANEKGYAALPGFGDRARYLARISEMRWVDVVRGSVACEARFTMEDGQINSDWKQAAGKMCEAAFSAR